MKCERCYYDNPNDEEYCINCGKKLPENSKVYTYMTIPTNKNKKQIWNYQKNNEDYYNVEYKGPDNTELNDYDNNENNLKNKNIWIAIILSLLITGLGHIYIKKYIRGIVFFIIAIISGILYLRYPIFIYLVVINAVYQIIDVILCYKKMYR